MFSLPHLLVQAPRSGIYYSEFKGIYLYSSLEILLNVLKAIYCTLSEVENKFKEDSDVFFFVNILFERNPNTLTLHVYSFKKCLFSMK